MRGVVLVVLLVHMSTPRARRNQEKGKIFSRIQQEYIKSFRPWSTQEIVEFRMVAEARPAILNRARLVVRRGASGFLARART